MGELAIHISWEYFLGLTGTIVALAYYANGRLTRLETSMEWVKDTLKQVAAIIDSKTLRTSRSAQNQSAHRGNAMSPAPTARTTRRT
jgi:hypothetical protein